ncbi:hypothetical protein BX661DRAFT_224936 [Kickxella alabastrina]|uniref:uncharacterized protein n=1 Tax=Kickxella alabastrina TaxID=61397 RepID=UPI002220E49B|nr:uncharacterized protein BX661DRAFT_224936 [Kickxella alabastrina]KAI7826780.1 hypothetical protein BX661DRAFT_224936 [Kickxella alabastrina]
MDTLADIKPDMANPDFWRQKQEWIKQMRLQFSRRPEFPETHSIIDDEGMLNQEYFQPPKDALPEIERKWGDAEKSKLLEGIATYGIGHFREISENLLSDWSGNDLRMKSIRVMGRQNLQLYKDWKGDAAAFSANMSATRESGCGLEHGKEERSFMMTTVTSFRPSRTLTEPAHHSVKPPMKLELHTIAA